VKAAAIEKARKRREDLLARFRAAGVPRPAAPAKEAPERPPETVA
jgi:hypothetical protein